MNALASLAPLAVAVFVASCSSSPAGGADPVDRAPRVVVIAVDGLGDARLSAGIADGSLPNLAALAGEGSRHRVRGLPGLESPAVWTTLFTGASPARTGVTGYVGRSNGDWGPIPAFGHLKFERLTPAEAPDGMSAAELRALEGDGIPRTTSSNELPFVWEHAARAGAPSVALRAPMAFDRAPTDGASVLFGAGYPDARGGLGDWWMLTSERDPLREPPSSRSTGTAGTVYSLALEGGRYRASLPGPVDHVGVAERRARIAGLHEQLDDPSLGYQESVDLIERQSEVQSEISALRDGMPIDVVVEPRDGAANVRIGDEEQLVAVGTWSQPYRPAFELSGGITVRATTRVKLIALEPEMRLYVHRLDVDPAAAPFWQPASAPASFAADLAAAHGPFETYGWTTATMGYKDGELDAASVIESAARNLAVERAMLAAQVADPESRLVVATFHQPMHLAHALTHLADVEHPLHDPAEAATTAEFLGREIRADRAVDAAVEALDAIVGETRAALADGDVLLVVSPHGASSFRRQVHLNNVLAEAGFLKVGDAEDRMPLGYVDWSGTRAYALGLGGIYLNLAGREAEGIVAEGDAASVLDDLERALLAARDPADGARMVASVRRPRRLFDGPHADALPDLVVGFAPPYRVSWGTTLGGLALDDEGGEGGEGGDPRLAPIAADNDKHWTGACVSIDPASVAGVLLSSAPLASQGEVLDERAIAPTILRLLDAPLPAEMELPGIARR